MNRPNQPKKLYRPNIAGIILDDKYPLECNIWVGLRNDMKNVWQFPQGGVDKDEDLKTAFLRELKEEIGTNNVDIISMCPLWFRYDFPNNQYGGYAGQKQKYFLAKLRDNNEVNIHTENPEFEDYKFVKLENLFDNISRLKVPIYRQVINFFGDEGHF